MARPALADANIPLAIDRATVRGRGERHELQRALQKSPIDGLGLGPDEHLLIPYLAVNERLETGGSSNRAFTRGFSRALRDNLEKAELNPHGPVGHGRPVRFSTRARMAAWLISEPETSERYVAGLLADLPGAETPQDWVAKVLLKDASALAHTAQALLVKRALAPWLITLPDSDLALIELGLSQTYGADLSIGLPLLEAGPHTTVNTSLADRRKAMALAVSLEEQFREAPLRPRQAAVGAALVYCAAMPSASRDKSLTRFVAAVLAHTGKGFEQSNLSADYERVLPENARPDGDLGKGGSIRSGQDFISPLRSDSKSKADPRIRENQSKRYEQEQGNSTADRPTLVEEYSPHHPEQRPTVEAITVAPTTADETFLSPFCGMLFLTNLLRRLGFVDDFGILDQPSQSLAPFELIDALGIHWFGSEYRRSRLHAWLSKNSSRRLGLRSFEHPLLQSVNAEPGSLTIIRGRQHLTLWHDDGFPLIDLRVRQRSRPKKKIARWVAREALRPNRVRPVGRKHRLPKSGTNRWIAALALCLEHEMDRRSGGYELAPKDLRLSGEVQFRDEKMTVRIALQDLPFAARFAALDRDPGWILEEGRSLAFFYT